MHFLILDYLTQNQIDGIDTTRDMIYEYLQGKALYYEGDEEKEFEKSDGTTMLVSENLTGAKLNDKLTEMVELGLIKRERKGSTGFIYSRCDSYNIDTNMLDFASEVMPISTVGSYLLDREGESNAYFAFKHNMISQVVDDEILYLLFEAINAHREVRIQAYNRRAKKYTDTLVVPLFIIRNVQTGRQYLACWSNDDEDFRSIRIDYINIERTTKNKWTYMGDVREDFEELRSRCREAHRHSWGVSLFNTDKPLKEVSFTIQVDEDTEYIAWRLKREKRNGAVEDLGDYKYRFSIKLYDSVEILPWITTFYGCITDLNIEDEEALEKMQRNFKAMIENHVTDVGDGEVALDA